MRSRSWRILGIGLCGLVFGLCSGKESQAQQLSPVTINFDNIINPLQNPFAPIYSRRALEVISAHDKARHDVLLAIDELIINKAAIVAGGNPASAAFRSVFGSKLDVGVDEATFNHVLNTYRSIENLLAKPTMYLEGGGASLTAAANSRAFFGGISFGLRHWGFSNSNSLQDYDRRFTTTFPTLAITTGLITANIITLNTTPVTNPVALPWWQDNNLKSALPAANLNLEPPGRLSAAAVDQAFLNQRMDIYNLPGKPANEYLGNVFFTGIVRDGGQLSNTLDPNTLSEKSLPTDAKGNQVFTSLHAWNSGNVTGPNGTGTYTPNNVALPANLSPPNTFTVDAAGVITVRDSTGTIIATYLPAKKIDANFFYNDPTTGKLIMEFQPLSQTLVSVGPGTGYSIAPLNQSQMIISSFAEFTNTAITTPNNPNNGIIPAGAFQGLQDLAAAFGGGTTGAGAPALGAFDAGNYGKFISLLNASGITDLTQFPPLGKNGKFQPAIPGP